MLAGQEAREALAAPPPDPRFGAVEAFAAPDQAKAAGVAWQRILFWWSALQPNSADDWYEGYLPDSILQSEIEAGRSVVGCLISTPRWANGTGNPYDPPRNLYLPHDHPDNYWGQFVRKIVSRYRGRIDYWIIWNEPDVWDKTSSGYTWSGSEADFYQLLKVAYHAARSANSDSRILLPGLTYWWDKEHGREQYFKRLLDVAKDDPTAPANNWYFDAAVLQLYNDPRTLYDVPQLFRQIMREHGFEKPIWINETNVTPWDDPVAPLSRDRFRATLDEQASFVIQAFAYALAAGVERIAIYKMRDGPTPGPGGEAFGLVRSSGTTRPAHTAYRVATRYFAGARHAFTSFEGHVVTIVLERENERITVVWAQSPEPQIVRLQAIAPEALLVNKYGETDSIVPQEGLYVLRLEGATHNTVPGDPGRYQIGGSPLILVEQKGSPSYVPTVAPGTDQGRAWISPDTGYAVSGEWLDYWKSRGGLDVFGHPISGVIADPSMGGQTVQVFQRAILEWHPENPPQYRVLRRLLGDVLYPGADKPTTVAVNAITNSPAAVMPDPQELGHAVSDIAPDGTAIYFKEYFDLHGGAHTFGYPKEPPKLRNGRWTQRFQAAVFEFHPENDIDGNLPGTSIPYRNYRVQLELLGEKYAKAVGLLPGSRRLLSGG